MKRIFATLMLFLFLLNVLGYYGIFVGLRFRNVQELVQKFDNNTYSSSETSTFKIPITVPYYTDSRDFERVDGEFEHQGEVYRLVKQRLYQDTLHIVCVKDKESKNIKAVLTDYVKTFADDPDNAKQTVKSLQLIKDYITFSIDVNPLSLGWEITSDYSGVPQNLIPSFSVSVIHPPERA